jgi:hypothetical protein
MTVYAVSRLAGLRRRMRLIAFMQACCGILVISACVAGCQMNDVGLNKYSKNDDIKMPPTVVNETYGNDSGTELTLLLRKGAGGLYEGASRDVRDGATLGIGELGNGQVKLRVMDIGAGQANIATEVASAKARGAVMIVSYLSPAETAAIAAIPPTQRPLLLNLASPTPTASGDVFNLASDELDSAADGIRAAIASGHKRVSLVSEANFPQSATTRLGNLVWASGGTFVGAGQYAAADASADIQAKNRS